MGNNTFVLYLVCVGERALICSTCQFLGATTPTTAKVKLCYTVTDAESERVHSKGLSGAGARCIQYATECGSSKSPVLPAFPRTGKCSVLQRVVDRHFPRVSVERRWQHSPRPPSPQQWKGYPTVLCGWNPRGPLGGSKALAGEEAARSRKSRAEQSWWVQVERSEASFQERRKDPRIHPNQFTPSLPSPLSIPTSSCFFLASITFYYTVKSN